MATSAPLASGRPAAIEGDDGVQLRTALRAANMGTGNCRVRWRRWGLESELDSTSFCLLAAKVDDGQSRRHAARRNVTAEPPFATSFRPLPLPFFTAGKQLSRTDGQHQHQWTRLYGDGG